MPVSRHGSCGAGPPPRFSRPERHQALSSSSESACSAAKRSAARTSSSAGSGRTSQLTRESLKAFERAADACSVRRLVAALACAVLVLAAPTAVLAKAKRSWAHAEIRLVTARGLMGGDPATFRPDDPLSRAALDELVAGLTGFPVPATGPRNAPVTLAGLDRRLVRALEL